MFYHVAAYRQLPVASVPLIVSVPSGNFGNLTAGLFAKRIGLPVAQIYCLHQRQRRRPANTCAAENSHPRPAIATYSNAMDVGNPNNFPRLLDLCRNRLENVQQEIWGHGATDERNSRGNESRLRIDMYISDPAHRRRHPRLGSLSQGASRAAQGLVLATAHPAKFAEVVQRAIGVAPASPPGSPPTSSATSSPSPCPTPTTTSNNSYWRIEAPSRPIELSEVGTNQDLRRRSSSINRKTATIAFTSAAIARCIVNHGSTAPAKSAASAAQSAWCKPKNMNVSANRAAGCSVSRRAPIEDARYPINVFAMPYNPRRHGRPAQAVLQQPDHHAQQNPVDGLRRLSPK